jgi:hypothetical protein
MPRAKKLAGTAVDPRNGERAAAARPAVALARFSLPRRPDGLDYDLRIKRMWKALFDDEQLSSILAPVDREIVTRWALAEDDAIKAHALAWANPISQGSMKQDIKSPYWEIRAQAVAEAERLGAQIGIGPLNRSKLGLALISERASLADLAAKYQPPGGDDADPRLS